MIIRPTTAIVSLILAAASVTSFAGGNVPGQVESGEAGYKLGCSLANSKNIATCAEMPSYQSMIRRQERERAERERQKREAEDRALRKTYPSYRNVVR